MKKLFLIACVLLLLPGAVMGQDNGGWIQYRGPGFTGTLSSGQFLAAGTNCTTAPPYSFTSDPNTGMCNVQADVLGLVAGGVSHAAVSSSASHGSLQVSTNGIGFAASISAASDIFLARDAANTLALRNGTNAQTFRVYGSYDGTNNRGLEFVGSGSGSVATIRSLATGTFASGGYGLLLDTADVSGQIAIRIAGGDKFRASNTTLLAYDDLIFATDNTYDIGASGATRPRNVYVGTNIVAGGDMSATGAMTVGATQKYLFTGRGGWYSSGDGAFNARTAAGTAITFLAGGGSAIASADPLPVFTGNVQHVTGTTSFTNFTTTGLGTGACTTLIFDGILTVTDGGNMKLAGDFVTTADDTLTVCYDGTNFYEVSRSVN